MAMLLLPPAALVEAFALLLVAHVTLRGLLAIESVA
jgi:hypothetical protein